MYNLNNLPTAPDFREYGEIILTGGEPLLYPEVLLDEIERIQKRTMAFIYMYTACTTKPKAFMYVMRKIHGCTLTLHTQEDVRNFYNFQHHIDLFYRQLKYKSMRLAVRKGITLSDVSHYWNVNYWEPMEVCPVPQGEVFMKLRP
jgi:hypothetical protein